VTRAALHRSANPLDPDPKYEEEVSGCTATVGVISKDKIYVVSATGQSFPQM
jgi:hypothetical protein